MSPEKIGIPVEQILQCRHDCIADSHQTVFLDSIFLFFCHFLMNCLENFGLFSFGNFQRSSINSKNEFIYFKTLY